MKRKNDAEVKEEPPACPGRQGSYNLAAIRPFLRHQGRNARSGGKNQHAGKERTFYTKEEKHHNELF